jgi:hypothetical protein
VASGGRSAAGNGGDGWGGAIATLFNAGTNVASSSLESNFAIGGVGSNGGNGFGGGAFNDATSSLSFTNTTVSKNFAIGGRGHGGGSDGQGIGGGIYNLGTLDLDALSVIRKNFASTSDNDIFG